MQLIPDHTRCFGGVLGLRLGVNHEHAQLRRRVVVGCDGRRELLLANGTVQPRCASRCQDGRSEVEHRGIRVQSAGSSPSNYELALRDVACELAIAEVIVLRLRRPRMTHRIAGLQVSVQLLCVAQCVRVIDVARDAEDRVARPIEVAIKAVHQVARETAKARLSPDPPASHPVRIMKQLE